MERLRGFWDDCADEDDGESPLPFVVTTPCGDDCDVMVVWAPSKFHIREQSWFQLRPRSIRPATEADVAAEMAR